MDDSTSRRQSGEKKSWKPKIDNMLLEALSRFAGFTGDVQIRMVLTVFRLTEGWQQESSQIPIKRLAWELGIPAKNIYRSLDSLIRMRVLIPTGNDGLRINQDVGTWRLDPGKQASDKVWCGDMPGTSPGRGKGRAFEKSTGSPFHPHLQDPAPDCEQILKAENKIFLTREKKILTREKKNESKNESKNAEDFLTDENGIFSPMRKDFLTGENNSDGNPKTAKDQKEAESEGKAISESEYFLRKCESDPKIESSEKSAAAEASDSLRSRTGLEDSLNPVSGKDEGGELQRSEDYRNERGQAPASQSERQEDTPSVGFPLGRLVFDDSKFGVKGVAGINQTRLGVLRIVAGEQCRPLPLREIQERFALWFDEAVSLTAVDNAIRYLTGEGFVKRQGAGRGRGIRQSYAVTDRAEQFVAEVRERSRSRAEFLTFMARKRRSRRRNGRNQGRGEGAVMNGA